MSGKNRKLYLECCSGISGDMTVAALLDLGADEVLLRRTLAGLNVSGYEISISRVKKSGLDACDFEVRLDAEHENHDHDMEYLHGHDPEHSHGGHHFHEHRSLQDILEILRSGDMTPGALSIAEKIFRVIARAESEAHGVSLEQVHFHEVGAVDSIVDIAAAAICLDNLGVEEVIVPELWEGRGTVRCQHGVLPVPVPAVCHIAQDYGLKLHMCNVEGELVTPTGAAIAAAIRTSDRLPERFVIEKTGMGAGKRSYRGTSGLLRIMMIRDEEDKPLEKPETIYKLESNIDDCSGEVLGYVMERLFEAGARDVNYTPVFMKKNRPAWQLNVICDQGKMEKLEQTIFDETTTIGIRRLKVERSVLSREIQRVATPLGTALVKVCETGFRKKAYPEYESAAELARSSNLPLQEVYRIIRQSWEDSEKEQKSGMNKKEHAE
ncbi:MAG: nickel pincer cofactor biosynthesis protein LarC [Lachnospiraceae bacterium]|nr:nickel pincer cofactor biosynthesis protein LarC [Lachnospiraceae bacterium]